jgi:hypothetical protein
MMVLSQRAMTLGAIVWGLSAHIAGTRFTLLTAAFLFCVTAVSLKKGSRITDNRVFAPEQQKG